MTAPLRSIAGKARAFMNRKLLIQVTAPTVLIGGLLFVACAVGAWWISRLQRDLAKILSQEVTSLQAVQELEIRVRQLRFRNFLNFVDPKHARLEPVKDAEQQFEEALNRVQQVSRSPDERALVAKIAEGYQRYRQELAHLPAELKRAGREADLHDLADKHPVKYVVDPCEELLAANKAEMAKTARQAEDNSRLVRLAMIGLGLLGPLSGLLAGYGIARGLSRSIYQLSVRVHDMAQRLEQDVGSVDVPADGDLAHLDRQLQHVVGRVEQVAENWQRQQREMLRAEQLSAVGQLAASVAHEVRNPLTAVKLLVDAARRPHKPRPLAEKDLQIIHEELDRLEKTVQNFLDFARPPKAHRSTADLREVVDQAVELVRARARQQGVAIDLCRPDTPVPADVDRGLLCNVLVNLFINGLDAMPQGGRLEVTLENVPAGGVRLDVADNGPGIAPEMAGRLFTPFASTKPTGTGLGLSISRRIIEEHGGRLSAVNRPQEGACFSITLPATKEEGVHAHAAGHR
jgi:signal transduction histidine kinase